MNCLCNPVSACQNPTRGVERVPDFLSDTDPRAQFPSKFGDCGPYLRLPDFQGNRESCQNPNSIILSRSSGKSCITPKMDIKSNSLNGEVDCCPYDEVTIAFMRLPVDLGYRSSCGFSSVLAFHLYGSS